MRNRASIPSKKKDLSLLQRVQTGCDAYLAFRSVGKVKVKVHHCTGTEDLYRPYGP